MALSVPAGYIVLSHLCFDTVTWQVMLPREKEPTIRMMIIIFSLNKCLYRKGHGSHWAKKLGVFFIYWDQCPLKIERTMENGDEDPLVR